MAIKTIRGKFIITFSIVTLLSSLCIGYVLFKQSEEIVTKKSEDELIILSQEGAKTVSAEIETEKEKLNLIASIEDIKNMDLEVQMSVLKNQVRYTDFTDIGIIKPGGEIYFSDGMVGNMKDEEYVRNAFNGKSGISDIMVDEISKDVSLMFALPIKSKGDIVGVIIGKRDGYDLSAITDSIKYHEKGYSYIIDEKGTDIAHPNRKFVEKANNSFALLEDDRSLESVVDSFKVVLEKNMGISEYSYNNENYTIGYAAVDGTDWKMVVAANTSEILGPISSIQKRITFVIGFIIVVNILIIYYIAYRSTKLGGVTKCNLIRESPRPRYEIDNLTKSIESISLSIKKSIKEINLSLDQLTIDSPQITEETKQSDIVAIAEETNLLALNATMEAGRVEQIGRKFTMEVEKIKTITGQSLIFTNGIYKVTENLVRNISQVESTIEGVVNITQKQIENVRNSESKDISMSEFIKESYKYISELDKTQREINETKDLILVSLQSIARIGQETSDQDRHVQAISQRQYKTTEEIKSAGNNLETLMDDLNSIIIKSKLRL